MDKYYTEKEIVKAIRKTLGHIEVELCFGTLTSSRRKLWESVDEELCKFIDATDPFVTFGEELPVDAVHQLDTHVTTWMESKEMYTEEVQSWLELLADQLHDLKEEQQEEEDDEKQDVEEDITKQILEQFAECATLDLKSKEHACDCHKEGDGFYGVINITLSTQPSNVAINVTHKDK